MIKLIQTRLLVLATLACVALQTGAFAQGFDLATPGSGVGATMTNPKDGTVFDWVPGGEFKYGEQKAAKDIGGYWIAKNDVTWGQYKQYCAATGHSAPDSPSFPITDDHPVVNVSYEDALQYAKWAGVLLPSEEQWEKAARGTDGRAYPWGDQFDQANCWTSVGRKRDGTTSVGSLPGSASPYGCLDMAGNVWQWTASWYDADQKDRVLRGGGWFSTLDESMRSDNRLEYDPADTDVVIGFRLAGPVLSH